MKTLRDLYLAELQDLYDAEQQITRALPKMAEMATHPQLKQAFQEHLEQTKGHIQRLDQIFQQMGQPTRGKGCKGMQGIITEGQEQVQQGERGDGMDAYLIAAAQKVEHYEISSYGTAKTWAKLLGETDAAKMLQQTENEEGETDKKLTRLAESVVNKDAQHRRAA